MWKRSTVQLVRHPQTKGRATDRLNLNHRATSRLYAVIFASSPELLTTSVEKTGLVRVRLLARVGMEKVARPMPTGQIRFAASVGRTEVAERSRY